jgi:hypothetical protein
MCLLGIAYFYYKHFVLGQRSWQFYLVVLAALFLGTKSIYLFMALLVVYHFMANSTLKAKFTVGVLVTVVYFTVDWFLQTKTAEKILAYFVTKADQMGIWYMLFSGRTGYLAAIQPEITDHWTFINYLVGGQDQINFMIEMDFFDLFFFLGIVGFLMYFLLAFTTIFRLNFRKPFFIFFVFAYMLLAFVAGHFFSSVINAMYLCLICLYFQLTGKPSQVLNEKNTADQ